MKKRDATYNLFPGRKAARVELFVRRSNGIRPVTRGVRLAASATNCSHINELCIPASQARPALTGPLARVASASVVHEDHVVGRLVLRPVAHALPGRGGRVRGLVHGDVVQLHRAAEVKRHVLVEGREGPAHRLGRGDAGRVRAARGPYARDHVRDLVVRAGAADIGVLGGAECTRERRGDEVVGDELGTGTQGEGGDREGSERTEHLRYV